MSTSPVHRFRTVYVQGHDKVLTWSESVICMHYLMFRRDCLTTSFGRNFCLEHDFLALVVALNVESRIVWYYCIQARSQTRQSVPTEYHVPCLPTYKGVLPVCDSRTLSQVPRQTGRLAVVKSTKI